MNSCDVKMFAVEENEQSTSEELTLPTFGPLWAIGHRNIRKNQVLVANRFVDTQWEDKSFDVSIMSLRYGITDKLTTFGYVPVVYNNTNGTRSDSGLGNFSINAEYLFFKKRIKDACSKATILGEITFPTAANVTIGYPLLDTQSYRFLLGTTGDYTTMNSYFYYSLGFVFFTKHEDLRPGSELLYEGGFAPSLYHSDDHDVMLFADFNGRYVGSDTVHDVSVPLTGGNILYLGAALEYRYKNVLMYLSFQGPAAQSFFGAQVKYRTSFYINVIF